MLEGPPLGSAEADARAVAAALEAVPCGFAVTLLQGAEADTRAFQLALDDLLGDAGPDDELLLYFAGHAVAIEPDNPHSEVLLVTADFEPARARRRPELFLALGTLHQTLYQSAEPGSVAIILDCCYAGNLVSPQPAVPDLQRLFEQYEQARDNRPRPSFAGKLRWLLAAAGPGEVAAEALGHGLLTASLLDALAGRLPAALSEGLLTPHSLMAALDGRLWGGQRPASLLADQRTLALADFCEAIVEQRQRVEEQHVRETINKRVQYLCALLHDHNSFLRDRLENFVGRVQELADIQALVALVRPTGGYVTITGKAGEGKSSIIAKLVKYQLCMGITGSDALEITDLLERAEPQVLAYHFIPLMPGPDYQVVMLRDMMARLILKYDLTDFYVASDNRAVLSDCFSKVLAEVSKRDGREVIFIDGLDQLQEDVNGERDLSFLPASPPSGIVFVLGTRPNDTLKPLELRKPQMLYELPKLSRPDFDLILHHRGAALEKHLADRFYEAMEGNALYLDLVGRELTQDNAATPEQIITQVADNPNHLFSLSLARLKLTTLPWRKVLKPILGLLLAAQEPLQLRAISMLIRQNLDDVRKGMKQLGGLLSRDGAGRYSLYHLKLRDFLRDDPNRPDRDAPFTQEEEEKWHQRLAKWAEQGEGGLATIWQDNSDIDLEQDRRAYARQHYLLHLYKAKNWYRFWEVLDSSEYYAEKYQYDRGSFLFMRDLELIHQYIVNASNASFRERLRLVPKLWRYKLLRCVLASQADSYPEGAIGLLAEIGNVRESIVLADLLTNELIRAGKFAEIGLIISKKGNRKYAQEIFQKAITIAHKVESIEARAEILKLVAEHLAEGEFLEEALYVVNSIDVPGIRACSLIRVLGIANRIEKDFVGILEAIRIVESVNDANDRAIALCNISQDLFAFGVIDMAYDLTLEVRKVLLSVEGEIERRQIILYLSETLAVIDCVDEAIDLSNTIDDIKSRNDALEYIVVALVRNNLLNRAVIVARSIEIEKKRDIALRLIGMNFAATGNVDQAMELRGCINSDHKNWILVEVIFQQAKAGDIEFAFEEARSLSDPYKKAEAVNKLIALLAANGHVDRALKEIDKIDNIADRIRALFSVSEALMKINELNMAIEFADRVGDLVRLVCYKERYVVALNNALEEMIRIGEFNLAIMCAEKSMEISCLIDDDIGRRHAINLTEDNISKTYDYLYKSKDIIRIEQTGDDPGEILNFLYDHWSTVARCEDLLTLLHPAVPLLAPYPQLLQELLGSFDWVDQILKK